MISRFYPLNIPLAAILLVSLWGCGQAKNSSREEPSPGSGHTATEGTAHSPQNKPSASPKPDFSKVEMKGPAVILQKQYQDWTLASEPRYFGPDTLYDLINGGSEVFVAYGFKQISTQDYRSDRHPSVTVTVEVYDMGDALGAFGRVSRYLDNLAQPQNAGNGLPEPLASRGILGKGDLVFWKGKYLVHITLLDENPEATVESIDTLSKQTMPSIGKAIFDAVTDDTDVEGGIAPLFPTEYLVPRSFAYDCQLAVGTESVHAFTARYESADTKWSLVLIEPAADTAGAGSRLEALKKSEDTIDAKTVNGYVVGVIAGTETKPDTAEIQSQLKFLTAALSNEDTTAKMPPLR